MNSTGSTGRSGRWLGSGTYNVRVFGHLAFVWAALNTFNSLLPLRVDTCIAHTILYTPLTGTSFIAALAGFSTICALLGRINGLFQ